MSLSSKKSRLERIINSIQTEGITAYEYGQNTSLTEFGVLKILKGEIKNPHESTIKVLAQYLKDKAQISLQWIETGKEPKKLPHVPKDIELSNLHNDELSSKIDEIAIFVTKNEKAMLKNEIFKNLLERKSYELAIKLIKDEDWKK